MKKIVLFITIGLIFSACKTEQKEEQKTSEKNDVIEATETVPTKPIATDKKETALFSTNFDWSKIPVSNVEIGDFPYLTPPEGYIVKTKRGEIAKNGMTRFSDFSKLIMYDDTSFFNAEGKVAEMRYAMTEKKTAFNQLKFDKSVDEYIESIGGVLLFKGNVPHKKIFALNKMDQSAEGKYIIGRAYNSDPVRHYALHQNNRKIMFQVWSNSAGGRVGVVELEGFKQTIKAPTASEMKEEIDEKGKAILNINFDTDKAVLKPEGQKIVDEIFILMSNNPDLKLSIEGHTDNTGTVERNQKLSGDRANTVMYNLAGKGIDIKRLKASGFGSEKPLVKNDTDENKAKNRRVELVKFQ